MSSAPAASAGRTVLITGGNRGIGFAVIQQMIRTHPDCTILLGARSSDKCKEALKKLGDKATNVKPLVVDIDHSASIRQAAKDVQQQYGGLDVLVNNAAIDQSTAEKTFHTNVDGMLEMISAFKPVLRENASILNLSSADSVDAINSFPKKLRDRWLDPELTIDGVSFTQPRGGWRFATVERQLICFLLRFASSHVCLLDLPS
jgi:NAD(P)-dependent dehydrogenase (short-subunit alcohol dehydrogenase family)